MSCSQLLIIRPLVNEKQYLAIEKYFESLLPSSKLTASNFATTNRINFQLSQTILQELVKAGLLKHSFGIRCPECGLLLLSVESLPSISKEQYCYNCDETYEISPEDVEVIYTFGKYPFVVGQQNKLPYKLEGSAALQNDSLAQLLKSGLLDVNEAFFSPTDEEYLDLEVTYTGIFNPQKSTKETGDTLENLIIKLFSLCKHFRVAPIRLKVNQIDCYVRNTLYIPGVSQTGCIDSFEIECKNEAHTPKVGYMNKLHSILRISGKKFGIIISKCASPKTFNTLANQIYLKDDIIMIALDKSDLNNIISLRLNLLECISRKIDAVKLNATKDLVEIGLYDA